MDLTEISVSNGTVVALLAELAFVVILPIALLVRWHRRSGNGWAAPVAGLIMFLVFSQMLEQILHYACLISDNAISRAIWENPWLYALYGGVAAGLFEETGRFMGFKYLLRRHTDRQTAIGYGLGHGGYECLTVGGLMTLSYLTLSLLLRSDILPQVLEMLPEDESVVVQDVLAQVASITPGTCIWGALERVIALTLHLSLSVLVFASVQQPEHGNYYLLAIALHAVADLPAGCYQAGLLTGDGGLIAVELMSLAVALVSAWLARRMWKTLPVEKKEEIPDEQTPD